jgi:3-deoxy-D-manno-octulosonate 8-phosphate phosphatase (KDO 8-P phosphatase)
MSEGNFQFPLALREKFKKVKLLLLDSDGVLTDGSLTYLEKHGWIRTYNIYDGYGITLLQDLGIPVGIISGGDSKDLKERIKLLKIKHSVLGSKDKLKSLEKISKKTKIPFENICFVGDDLFDIPALEKVGLAITVPDAMPEVKAIVHYQTTRRGGSGAVREVTDAIRKIQNLK